MVKKLFSAVLVLLLVNLLSSVAYASSDNKATRLAERVKQNILKLGSGPDAMVEVKLRDKQRLKGYVAEAGEETFVVVNETTRVETTIAYANVTQVKGQNLSLGVKIAIGVGIGVGVLLLFALIFKDQIMAY
jgi:hypothetical protein